MNTIYQSIFDILNDVLFGSTVVVGSFHELVLTQVSTILTLCYACLPLIIVWSIIRGMWR